MKIFRLIGIGVGSLCFLLMTGQMVSAQFFKGKTVSLVVGASNHGTYAAYARVLAQHMPKYIAGNPKIILKIKGGSGGRIAANYMHNAAPKDGSMFSIVLQTVPVNQFLSAKKSRFDVSEWNWIGNMSPLINFLGLWHKSPVQSLEEAKKNISKNRGYREIFSNLYLSKTYKQHVWNKIRDYYGLQRCWRFKPSDGTGRSNGAWRFMVKRYNESTSLYH